MSIETAPNEETNPTSPATTPPGRSRNELRAAILDSLRHIDTSAPLYLTAASLPAHFCPASAPERERTP